MIQRGIAIVVLLLSVVLTGVAQEHSSEKPPNQPAVSSGAVYRPGDTYRLVIRFAQPPEPGLMLGVSFNCSDCEHPRADQPEFGSGFTLAATTKQGQAEYELSTKFNDRLQSGHYKLSGINLNVEDMTQRGFSYKPDQIPNLPELEIRNEKSVPQIEGPPIKSITPEPK